MPAYILVFPQEIWAEMAPDPTVLDPYTDQIEATLAAYGGRYLRLRRDPIEVLEGDWQPHLGMAMLEFPSMEQARTWYHSAAYAPLREFRRAHARSNLILVDGMPPGTTLRSVALAEVEHVRAQWGTP